ncbi:MAG: M3 family metallopeptidase [Salinivirgaceae bacterium]|nr:M3 family metallopeptidase [Salinivirgaceae bacterium]
MKQTIIILSLTGLFLASCMQSNNSKETMENPFLSEYNTPFQTPPFDKIKSEHYMPAFVAGMKQQKENIDKIINNTEEASFENTIEAIETSGELLDKVGSVFYNLKGANTNEEIKTISVELAPIMSSHSDDIKLNEKLFEKVNAVYKQKETLNLTSEQMTLLDNTFKSFVRGGANLKEDVKARFREINKELSLLYLKFGDNLLAENNRFQLLIDDEKDLSGLSENFIQTAALAAKNKGLEGKWVFTIQNSSFLPFMETADNRSLREKMYNAYIMKGDNNDSLDNKELVLDIVNLRIERAHLLGYNSHADFILEKNMAKEPKNVYALLEKLMPAALKVAKKEVADMQKMAIANGENFKIEPWDYAYYAAKVKQEKYALNENEIRPYLQLENAREGMFWVANQLYGISFTKLSNVATYHPEVDVFEVKEENGDPIGLLYLDYHPRESKRSGAWCTSFRSEKYKDGKRVAPLASIVCNFSAPIGDTPALLTVDETETIFHEFGHALDGLFANKHYASLSTPRDFVELPSQIMENWAFAPEVLNHYAKHYKTGEAMPQELINKIEKAGKFNQGFATSEYLAASFLDMDWHTLTEKVDVDVNKFEEKSMKKINLINEIAPRYRSTYFQHIFTGNSYSSGYYSYIWAEVLDADAFEAFKEAGLFDKTIAAAFRTNVLELGGTEDAMELYKKFRGAEPKIEPLLERRGLN